jgi:hypothetical protein
VIVISRLRVVEPGIVVSLVNKKLERGYENGYETVKDYKLVMI